MKLCRIGPKADTDLRHFHLTAKLLPSLSHPTLHLMPPSHFRLFPQSLWRSHINKNKYSTYQPLCHGLSSTPPGSSTSAGQATST